MLGGIPLYILLVCWLERIQKKC